MKKREKCFILWNYKHIIHLHLLRVKDFRQNLLEIGANKFSTKTAKSANKRPNLPTHLVSNNIIQSCVSDSNFGIYRETTHLVEIFLPPAILKLRPPIGQ